MLPYNRYTFSQKGCEICFLPSATVLAERLCFHRCLSVHGGGEVYITPLPGRHPPARQTPPLPGRHHPCQADTPLPGRHPPPPRWVLQGTVRILLEFMHSCFFVLTIIGRLTVSKYKIFIQMDYPTIARTFSFFVK